MTHRMVCGVVRVASVKALAAAAGLLASADAGAQVFNWAAAVSGVWGDSGNWSPSGIPGFGFGQTAVIDATGAAYTVDYNLSGAQHAAVTLNSSDAELRIFNQSMGVTDAVTVQNGLLRLRGSLLSAGSIVNQSTIVLEGNSTLTGAVTQTGALRVVGGAAGGALANVSGFTNQGAIVITSEGGPADSTLRSNSSITNASGASIVFAEGAGGARTWGSGLVNSGTVDVGANTVFDIGGSQTATNNGQFTIGAGRTLTLGGLTFDPRFAQAGGTLSVLGAFEVSRGTFEFTGGTITGGPVTLRNDSSLTLGASSGAGAFSLRGSGNTVTGDVRSNQTLAVIAEGSGVNFAVLNGVNRGSVTVTGETGASVAGVTVGGNAAGASIAFNAGGGGGRVLNGQFTNLGALSFNTDGILDVGSSIDNRGTLRVASGATVEGRGGFTLSDGGSLQVDGTLVFGREGGGPATFSHNGGAISGSVIIRNATLGLGASAAATPFRIQGSSALQGSVKAGQTLTVETTPSIGLSTLLGSGSTNQGTLRLAASPSGTTGLSGNWTNAATGVIDIAAGQGSQGALLSGFIDNLGTINVGRSLTLGFGATLRQRGAMIADVNTPSDIALTISQGAALTLESANTSMTYGQNSRVMNVAGLADVRSGQLPFFSNVGVTSTGTLRFDSPGQESFVDYTGVTSSGLIEMRSDVTLRNAARIALSSTGSIQGPATPPSSGTPRLRLTGGAYLDLLAVSADVRGVVIDIGQDCFVDYGLGTAGLPPAVSMTLRDGGALSLANLGLLRAINLGVAGDGFMDGSLGNGSTVRFQAAAGAAGTARINHSGGLTAINPGVMTFSGLSGLEEYSGGVGLVNRGAIIAEASAVGTVARISTLLLNEGSMTLRNSLTVTRAGAAHTNSGSITIDGAAVRLSYVGQSFTNLAGGSISGTGTLDVRFARYLNRGSVAVGRVLVGDGTPEEFPTIGTLMIEGDASFEGESRIVMEIAGRGAGTRHDTMKITGDTALGGTLEVSLIQNFAPRWGDVFNLITAGGVVAGSFEAVALPQLSDANLRWWSSFARGATLGVRLVADTNRDNTVDFFDLNNVLAFYGQAGVGAARIGDANEDGVVDFLDLNAVLAFYGQSAVVAVPAPGGALALAAALSAVSRRRRAR